MRTINVSFWNLENLFDVENSPRRTDKLQRAIGSSLSGWNQQRLDGKITQLSSIIAQLHNGAGPDILGVCEIENDEVLTLLVNSINAALPGHNYDFEHHQSPDQRGIDVAFIYDSNVVTPGLVFDHVVMRRTATRDILQVNFTTSEGNLLALLCNHWPSRSGGQFESEGYRFIAGETLAYFHQRILEKHGNDTAVLAMGDFNDEPFNRSITQYSRSLRSRDRVVRARTPYFLNLMWPLMDQGIGTFFFNNEPNMLDQFLANDNLLVNGRPIVADPDSVSIDTFPEMIADGVYPVARRFGAMGKPIDLDGYSDHFPISIQLHEREAV